MCNKNGIKISFIINQPITFAAAYTGGRKSLLIELGEKRIKIALFCDGTDDPTVLLSEGVGRTGEKIEIDISGRTAVLYRNGTHEDEKQLTGDLSYRKEDKILSPDLTFTVEDGNTVSE